MEGIIPVEKGKHLFAKVPKNIPKEQRDKIIKEQKRIKTQQNNNKYYGVRMTCPLCHREVAKIRLDKHQKTNFCKKYSNKKKMKTND